MNDRLHIRIGGCLHVGRDTINNRDVYKLNWYANNLMNTVSKNELSSHRVIHAEVITCITKVVDREYGDELIDSQSKCDGPRIAGKSYDRRAIIRSDFVATVF